MYLSVIIPCYNEEENLKRGVLRQVREYLKSKKFPWEIIISDDGSTDASRELIKSEIKGLPGFTLLENKHGGKPSALLNGINKAKGKFILFCDMDQSTPITELDKLLPFADENFSAVIGSRGLVRKNFPIYRKLGAVVFASIRRALILPEIIDTQCGFKLFKSDILKKVFPELEFFKSNDRTKGWIVTSFDVELLHLIKKFGGTIKEVSVIWHDKDVGGKSKGLGIGKYIKESREMFSEILLVKLNDLRGLYKKV